MNTLSAHQHFETANQYFRKQDYKKAIEYFSLAIVADNKHLNSYINLGNCFFKLAQYHQAIDYYSAAITISEQAALYYNRGKAKNALGNYEGAVADYDKAIELEPNAYYIYVNRGNTKLKLQNYNDAINDYTIATGLKPDLAEAYYNRALALMATKADQSRAEAEMAKAFSLVKKARLSQ